MSDSTKTRLLPRLLPPAAALLAALAVAGGSARAISGGSPDGMTHPEVGLLLAHLDGKQTLDPVCSGTLISPQVFLTASHCTAYLAQSGVEPQDAYVSFDPSWDPNNPGTALQGTYFTNPLFGKGGMNDPHDIAVVVLDERVDSITPALLPSPGLLGRLPLKSARFTPVGYGDVRDTKKGGPHAISYGGTRRYASQGFLSLEPAWLNLSTNFSTGSGGTCYGDSGGPHFYGDQSSNELTAITITGDTQCRATDKDYRLDTPSATSFLSQFQSYGPFTYWGS